VRQAAAQSRSAAAVGAQGRDWASAGQPHRHSGSTVTRKCSPHAPNPLPHLRAPARVHRKAHAHAPHLPAPDAHGAAGPRIYQATASPAPAQDVARRILGEDVTQIDYYTERVRRLVGKVHLQRHHPLRPRHLLSGGRRGAERRRARRAAMATQQNDPTANR
jgi:hypothetical protein